MKYLYLSVLLIFLLVWLTACPYKETYRVVSSQPERIQGLEVFPVTLFYSSKEKISTCHVGFRVENLTDTGQKVQLSASFLSNAKNKLRVEKIYGLGVSFPPNNVFVISPKSDTLVGLSFQDSTRNFGDTIHVGLDLQGVGQKQFLYKRIRR